MNRHYFIIASINGTYGASGLTYTASYYGTNGLTYIASYYGANKKYDFITDNTKYLEDKDEN